MADQRIPLLRGRISNVDSYQAPQNPPGRPSFAPWREPQAHAKALLAQLDTIAAKIAQRAPNARDELAKREIIAVRPAEQSKLAPDQLDSSAADARLVGVVPETGTVVLDVASGELQYLRKKIEAFADDTMSSIKTDKDGLGRTSRASEKAVAPIAFLTLASLDDVASPTTRAAMADDKPRWLEIACRGGYHHPDESRDSRAQLVRQMYRLGVAQPLNEFAGPELIYFYARLTSTQIAALQTATDCIVEVEFAPAPLRDLKVLDDVRTKDLAAFTLTPPSADAPSVVLLDTGVATTHPLLKSAILTATTVVPGIASPEDTFGHGTKMAGLALYPDVGTVIDDGHAAAGHWLQSSRLLVKPQEGTASDENYDMWPVLTQQAVISAETADAHERDRAFVLAVTRTMQEPPLDGLVPTLWSQAVDQLAFNGGRGRLLVVSAGNARPDQWLSLAASHPALQLSEKIHQPAQGANVLSVGAFTTRVQLPDEADYAEARPVAERPGGISPFTSTGLVGTEWPIKPDVVAEGGNLAVSGTLVDSDVPTLSALTTSHKHTVGRPIGLISMTSEASARVARLCARIWTLEPKLRPESVRALVVHSASWSSAMAEDFPGIRDRVLACGYGVPDERLASECAQGVATIVIEDSMPNAVTEDVPKKTPPKKATTRTTEPKTRRKVKLFRLPIPDSLLTDNDPDVELRVTLSYFAEPNKFGRKTYHGLDLKWDMQGPYESEPAFLQRINNLNRPEDAQGKRKRDEKTKSFEWHIGTMLRSRGTVQSDRWRGKMSQLIGDKLIAVVPILGWWEQQRALKNNSLAFSLVVSIFGPGVYAAIKPMLELPVDVEIDT